MVKKFIKKITVGILLCFLCLFAFFGCNREPDKIIFAALRGPTTIGALQLINSGNEDFEFLDIFATADEISAKFTSNQASVIAVPANYAAILNSKLNDEIVVLAINTFNVLSLLEKGETVTEVSDLTGKTILVPGKATTPDYTLRFILDSNNLKFNEIDDIHQSKTDSVNVKYISEAAAIPALISEGSYSLCLVPEPVATVIVLNTGARRVFSISDEWQKITGTNDIVTGVIVCKKSFLDKNKEKVNGFLALYKESIEYALNASNYETVANWMVKERLTQNSALAKASLPYFGIGYLDKIEMQAKLENYYEILYNLDTKSVGGKIPDNNFYYLG
ncbi:MAG: ABC transporter substrate-binding protein [Firmicutes bacterium]|nr:ABC transporter substrate-binding protein [Bacillota bacterium]